VSASHPTTKTLGDVAEAKAEAYLVSQGYVIIERNWKIRWCEVDIIASKGAALYFVEVKYRSRLEQGGGVAAITRTKQRQMSFAAEFYMAKYAASIAVYSDRQLAVIIVSPTGVEPPLLVS